MLTYTDTQPITDPILMAYLDKLARTGRSYHTIKQHRQTARRVQEFLSSVGRDVHTATPNDMEELFDTMTDLATSTRRSHLRRLRSVYRYAQRRGVVTLDPTYNVELPREPDTEPITIENETLRQFKREIRDDQQWAQFHLLTFAGLRRCEAVRLQWHELNFPTSTLTVTKGKGGKLRHVPIHPQLAEALGDLSGPREGPVIRPKRQARWIGTDTWDTIMREYTGGLHTAHDFRRTVASSLALNGISDPIIDKIMGWAPRAVGRRYYIKVAGPELQRAILRLYADDPI